MANIITFCRILCSLVLLFFPAFSHAFYVLYCLAGFTDMIDGTIARKTNTAGEFGSKLDTFADMVFVSVCLIKLLPVMMIPAWLWVCIGVIAAIKVANILWGYIAHKKLTAEHTIFNKITGAVLFVFPFTLSFIDLNYSGGVICIIAAIAAMHEGYLVVKKTK